MIAAEFGRPARQISQPLSPAGDRGSGSTLRSDRSDSIMALPAAKLSPKGSCTSPLDKLFNLYLQELIEWNKKFNLTAITDPEEIRLKHFDDSLTILQTIKLTNESVVDIGTGAGFPGIPLKIACPEIKLTLIEATRKKTEFLKHIVARLDLKNVEIIWGRAEEISRQGKYRGKFALAVSRAAAKLDLLCKYCLPFVKQGGLFIAYKGDQVEDEVKATQNLIKALGGKLIEIKKVKLPDSEIIHSLVIIEKVAATPD